MTVSWWMIVLRKSIEKMALPGTFEPRGYPHSILRLSPTELHENCGFILKSTFFEGNSISAEDAKKLKELLSKEYKSNDDTGIKHVVIETKKQLESLGRLAIEE